MKLRNIFAGIAACAITASAMAVTAFAEKTITNANDNENFSTDCKELDVTAIYGVKANITAADGWNASGLGGGIGFNADKNKGTGWTQFEWGISGEGKDAKNTKGITIDGKDGKFTITLIADKAYFAATDEWDSVWVSAWWGSDFKVDSLVPLDKDGKEIGAKTEEKAAETTAATTAAADTKAESKTDGTKTGDAGVAMAVAGLALAGAAAYVVRKKD